MDFYPPLIGQYSVKPLKDTSTTTCTLDVWVSHIDLTSESDMNNGFLHNRSPFQVTTEPILFRQGADQDVKVMV